MPVKKLLLVPVDPAAEARTRRHEQIVAMILNSLIRQGVLVQDNSTEWALIPDVPQLVAGPPGRNGQNASSLLNGTVPPASRVGIPNDYYFQSNGDLWWKTSPFFGAPPRWTKIASLVGPPGKDGKPGAPGQSSVSGGGGGGTTYSADESTLHLSGTTFSIISTYGGQVSIVTVGTIGTGVWQGTPVAILYGGTGATTASGARTNLGLGTAATHAATDFDTAGAAAAVLTTAEAYTDSSLAAFTGETNIVTLGTITTGTWHGTIIGQVYGGTGKDTSGATDGQLLIGKSSDHSLNLATLTGTTNRLTVTNAGGTITLNVSTSYAGDTSIVTLGTVTTGTWNGTAVDVAHGGTGDTSLTAYAPLCGGTTSTGAVQSVASVGTTGQVLTSNGPSALATFQAVTGSSPKGYVYGLPLAYATSTTVSVGPGLARDSANAADITLAAAGTISTGTLGAINGLDRVALPGGGTVATSTTLTLITGTSTSFLTDFAPGGVPRTLTGTIGTGGAGSTTITGTSSKFLAEVSVGDLIGNASVGYSRVVTVDSDVSLTCSTALTIANGSTGKVLENVTFQAGSQTAQTVTNIISNTNLHLAANSSATASGLTGYAGALPNTQIYLMVWVGSGGSGTGVYLSTQRTTPFGISGYNTSVRRIGSLLWTGSAIIEFDQWGLGIERWYQFEMADITNGNYVLSNGSATTWTRIPCSVLAPPSATCLTLLADKATNGTVLYLRKASTGNTGVTRPLQVVSSGTFLQIVVNCACDGAQCVDYVVSSASGAYLEVIGYQESL